MALIKSKLDNRYLSLSGVYKYFDTYCRKYSQLVTQIWIPVGPPDASPENPIKLVFVGNFIADHDENGNFVYLSKKQ